MHKYRLIAKKGEGTFSEVLKAQSIKNGKYLAIKCMKNHFDSIEQVNNLREIQALRRLSPHPNIIKLYEVLYDQPTGRLALVFELMDMNIYELIRGRRHYLKDSRVKIYMYQLMKAMDHMHRNGIFHRDIKPENILISEDLLKVADFGSCRGIYSKQPYTEYISTRWYRAPECLLTDGYYGYKMDMWGVGCVMFEIIALFPLFPGTNELNQIECIHKVVGTPAKEIISKFKRYATHIDFNFPETEGKGIAGDLKHCSKDCTDLIEKLLAYDPEDRLSARQALRQPYFAEIRQTEKRVEKMHAKPKKSSSPAKESSTTTKSDARRSGRRGEEWTSRNRQDDSSKQYHSYQSGQTRKTKGQKHRSKGYAETDPDMLPSLSSQKTEAKKSSHTYGSSYKHGSSNHHHHYSSTKAHDRGQNGPLPMIGKSSKPQRSKKYKHAVSKIDASWKKTRNAGASKSHQSHHSKHSNYDSKHGGHRGHYGHHRSGHSKYGHGHYNHHRSKKYGSSASHSSRTKNKYMSPYSQKYLAKMRGNDV